MRSPRLFVALAALAGSATVLLAGGSPASAATDTVTSCSGAGSLPAVVAAAASGDTITVSTGLNCTGSSSVVLTSPITINQSDLAIVGPGAGNFVVTGSDGVQCFVINSTGTVSLSGLSVEHCRVSTATSASALGGGIDDSGTGTLNLSAMTISNNTTSTSGPAFAAGGGVAARGNLNISHSTVSQNVAEASAGEPAGGGVLLAGSSGNLSILDSSITGNSATSTVGEAEGAGVDDTAQGGTLTVSGSTISHNTVDGFGAAFGGGLNDVAEFTNIVQTTIEANSAHASGSETGSAGGGLSVAGGNVSTVITASTIDENTATADATSESGGGASGGGLAEDIGAVSVTNSTLFGNRATGNENTTGIAGAFSSVGSQGSSVSLTDDTLADNGSSGGQNQTFFGSANVGGGIAGNDAVAIEGTIIADGSQPGNDCAMYQGGSVSDLGSNLDDDGTCGFTAAGDLSDNHSVNLAALANNGGPTQTMALNTGSSAIGTSTFCALSDQRSVPRNSSHCDIGAFDSSGASISVTAIVSGTESFGSAPVFTFSSNAPSGVLSGTPSCTKAGVKALSALTPGTYTLNGSSCSGLVASPGYALTYVGGRFIVTKGRTRMLAAPYQGRFSAQLVRSADNAALQGQTIRFAIANRAVCSARTNADGVASCVPPLLLVIQIGGKSFSYTASYSGNTDYLASSATGSL